MRGLLYLAMAGCWATPVKTPEPSHAPFVLSQHGAGPITDQTPATLNALRDALPELRVVPKNDPNLEFDLYDDGKPIGFVVPNDDGKIYNVHVTSATIAVDGKSWRAGSTFQGSRAIDNCECWGGNPICYKKGEHLAVAFQRSCLDEVDPRSLRVLDGLVIQRVIWSNEPLGAAD
ncbi:MAG: hypothetical protein QM831_02075 [Kofleriaceae bacterium]